MSIEALIEKLIASVDANTAALKGAKAPAASTTSAPAGKPATKTTATKPKKTLEEVKKAAVAVKDKLGTAEAKRLIKEVGEADELAKIEPKNFDAFVEACEKAVADGEGGGEEQEEL